MYSDEAEITDAHSLQGFVDMFGRNPNLQMMLKHSLEYNQELGCSCDYEEDYRNWRWRQARARQPLRHFVVTSEEDLTRIFGPPQRFYSPSPNCSHLASVNVQAKEKDTESKARLSEETKKNQVKAQKKKKKKLKRKEKKRKEKLEKEKRDTVKKEAETEVAQQGEEEKEEEPKGGGATNGEATAEDVQSSDDSEQQSSDEDYDSCTSEELDMTSSFVSKAAQIAQRKINVKAKAVKVEKKSTDKEETPPKKPIEGPELQKKESAASSDSTVQDYVQISNNLAVIGNEYANKGEFTLAVNYFTQAIKWNPTEYKLFSNRSFCFEKLQEYEKALADAELCLGICPGWARGLFRKGRALAGLKRYDEAAQTFREVLQEDGSRAEAAQELMRVQITQLMEYGFTREQSTNALIIHETVEKALEVLSNLNCATGVAQVNTRAAVQVVNVSGVSPILSAKTNLATPAPLPAATSQDAPRKTLLKTPSAPPLPSVQKQSPELFPIWVGNLTPSISESMIINLFNKVGSIHSLKVLSNRRCAFINYTKQECCDEAIRRFNRHGLNGVILLVKYPDRIPPGLNISKSAHRAHHSYAR